MRYRYDEARKRAGLDPWVPLEMLGGMEESIDFPDHGTGKYFDVQANRWFHSKREKRAWMKAKNIVEFVPAWSNPWKGLPEAGDHHYTKKHFLV